MTGKQTQSTQAQAQKQAIIYPSVNDKQQQCHPIPSHPQPSPPSHPSIQKSLLIKIKNKTRTHPLVNTLTSLWLSLLSRGRLLFLSHTSSKLRDSSPSSSAFFFSSSL